MGGSRSAYLEIWFPPFLYTGVRRGEGVNTFTPRNSYNHMRRAASLLVFASCSFLDTRSRTVPLAPLRFTRAGSHPEWLTGTSQHICHTQHAQTWLTSTQPARTRGDARGARACCPPAASQPHLERASAVSRYPRIYVASRRPRRAGRQ